MVVGPCVCVLLFQQYVMWAVHRGRRTDGTRCAKKFARAGEQGVQAGEWRRYSLWLLEDQDPVRLHETWIPTTWWWFSDFCGAFNPATYPG